MGGSINLNNTQHSVEYEIRMKKKEIFGIQFK